MPAPGLRAKLALSPEWRVERTPRSHRVLHSFRFEVVTPSPTRSGYNSYGAIAVTGTPPYFNASIGTIAQEFADAGMALGAAVAKRCQRT